MNITLTRKIEAEAVPVIILRNETKITSHPFYRLLAPEDRALVDRFMGKVNFERHFTETIFLPSGGRVFVLASGKKDKFNFRRAVIEMRQMVVTAKRHGITAVEVHVPDFFSSANRDLVSMAEAIAIQCELANFDYNRYRTTGKENWRFLTDVYVYSANGDKKVAAALAKGKVIGEEINSTRALANTPGGDMTPALLAAAAGAVAKQNGLKITVFDEKEMKKLGMGGVLGVGKGSDSPPRFIILEYAGGKKSEQPVVLVGKGITFDSGGLNLKPSDHIYEMHMDMSGGAAVIHTIAALARLKVKKNVVGLVPAAENMVSGESYRPGDVLTTMSGKTIEVLNTDAEGRVILSDALTYAKHFNPRLVIDIATLTGAAMVALGQRASGLFTTDTKLEKFFRDMGEATADFVWPLPLWEEYEKEIEGTFGDVSNTGKTRYGGAITAAVFLWQFIKGTPWVHLDIAPRMTAIEGEHLAKGAAGAPVNLLVHALEKF